MRDRATTPRRLAPSAALLLLLAACTDDPVRPEHSSGTPDSPAVVVTATAAPASVSRKVQVPSGMRAPPFDVDRFLTVPPNFTVSVYARVTAARFMAVAPNGDLLVSRPGAGKVVRIRPGAGAPIVSDYLTGLRKPHDLVFHTIGSTTYLYVAESHQVDRYVYNASTGAAGARQIVVAGLPDASTPELHGVYGHELKNIALDGNHRLYVSIASTCNVCTSDRTSNPQRAAIYQYDAAGGGRRLFARGLRNAEGLAFVPGTNTLWAVVNHRDNIPYPFNDGSGNYGRVFAGYVDNHPPEAFTRVRDGGDYGWPYCNPNPDTPAGYNDMPYDRDYNFNRTGAVNCAAMDRISRGIQAHSAPLGLTFLQGTAFPTAYRNGAVVAFHGSWNRTTKVGYRVVYYPWNAASGRPGSRMDLVRGWLVGGSAWGRPVDAVVDRAGSLLISDDRAGAIYKLTYTATQSVARLTLIDADRDDSIAGDDPIPDGAMLELATP